MKRLFFLLLMVALILQGCQLFEREESYSYLDTSKNADRTYYLDPHADQQFREFYSMDHLVNHALYSVNDDLHFEVHFDPQVSRLNIQNARNYFTRITLIRDIESYDAPYYTDEVRKLDLDHAHLRVFIDDQLYLYEGIDQTTLAKIYYENHEMDLEFKNYQNPALDALAEKLKNLIPEIQRIEGLKPIKDSVVILRIHTEIELSPEQIEAVQKNLEEATEFLENKEAAWPYSPTTSHLGVILQFYTLDNFITERVYLNGLEKHWMDSDWRGFDFFRANFLMVNEQ